MVPSGAGGQCMGLAANCDLANAGKRHLVDHADAVAVGIDVPDLVILRNCNDARGMAWCGSQSADDGQSREHGAGARHRSVASTMIV